MSQNETDHYLYPATGETFRRVTTILDGTDALQRILIPWAAKITATYAVEHWGALGMVKRREGRDAAIAEVRRESERIRDLKREVGGYVHDVIRALVLWQAAADGAALTLPVLPAYLAGLDYDGEPVEQVADWMLTGFLNWVADFQPEWIASEMTVFNPALRVAGTLDAIVRIPGLTVGGAGRLIPGGGVVPCVDVKTGKHLSVTWREQIAAYRHMPECQPDWLGDLYPMPPTDCGAVLHLRPPSEYPRGYRFMLISGRDDADAWNLFRRAVELYEGRRAASPKPGKVCYPLQANGTVPPPLLRDLDGEGYGRALTPLIKALGTEADLDKVAAMSAGDLVKVKGIKDKLLAVIRVMLADHGLHLAGEHPQQQQDHEQTGEAA